MGTANAVSDRITFALNRLAQPALHDFIVRPVLRGRPVAQFALPLDLCKTGNVQLQRGVAGQPWRIAKMKQAVADAMRLQCAPWDEPLKGRPQVIAVRFSSVVPDRCSDFAKWPIDVLCKRTAKLRNRLGIIVDDSPRVTDVHAWWEPASPGQGFVFLEVRI
jgi:hypothetical protein